MSDPWKGSGLDNQSLDDTGDDDFLPITRRYTDSIVRWDNPMRVYGCDYCSCVFIPVDEGEVIYTDRYILRGGCVTDCPCHTIPESTDRTGDPLDEQGNPESDLTGRQVPNQFSEEEEDAASRRGEDLLDGPADWEDDE
jgi:hypothetical protein